MMNCEEILVDYHKHKNEPEFDLKAFVQRHFTVPNERPTVAPAEGSQSVDGYIANLWDVLRQQTDEGSGHSSLLPLPHPYVVPGGRFRELYYWDFLIHDAWARSRRPSRSRTRHDTRFCIEIDCYGHVPTGNRSYYLSRSQPPFFSLMVDLVARHEGDQSYVGYLPQLKAEYEYWMDGSAALQPKEGHRRVVRLADEIAPNRYWDDRPEPRDKSYREDVQTASERPEDPAAVYRSLRAGANWDGISAHDGLRTALSPHDQN